MAIGWLAVLRSVPWSEVIRNAPKVAEGAKKLWKAVAKKPSPPAAASAKPPAAAAPAAHPLAALEARVSALETTVADLHDQMLASSELIKALAEQNALLVQRVEANRLRLLRLGMATAIIAAAALLGLVLALSRA